MINLIDFYFLYMKMKKCGSVEHSQNVYFYLGEFNFFAK